jgi:response regulator RpfG family c-di-GMP phosphodiesterase
MVYIRPSAPLIATTPVRSVTGLAHTPEEHSLENDVIVNEYLSKPQSERRKQQDDRRQQRKDALLETRAGRDRRKGKPSISVSI